MEIALQIVTDGFDGGVHSAADFTLLVGQARALRRINGVAEQLMLVIRAHAIDQAPESLQESELTFNIGVVPFEIFFRRCLEQDEHPCRVSSVAIDHGSWIHAVVLRLRHFLEQHLKIAAIHRIFGCVLVTDFGRRHITTCAGIAVGHPLNHPLGEQALERLSDVQ